MKEDKRDPTHVIPFKAPQVPDEELEPDVYGSMGLLLAIVSMLFRVKILSLLGLFASIYSWLNQKKTESGGLGSGLRFTIVAFLFNYAARFFIPVANTV